MRGGGSWGRGDRRNLPCIHVGVGMGVTVKFYPATYAIATEEVRGQFQRFN